MSRAYTLVLEPGEHNWSAFFPEVPGCVATGATREETIATATEALAFHLEGLRQAGEPLPEPHADAVEVSA
ncbi:MAG TPA: type II toxin-antitoxin system HicB family antitoxin [Acidimicrobiales bacterium]|nr:type II toxin-antitoxin system HicB family antitoxin [Acidimicrobiales bacterium]